MCTLEPRAQDHSAFKNGFRLDRDLSSCVFIMSKKTLNSVLLKYWNSHKDKSLSTIRQCFSCLLKWGDFKNMQKYFLQSPSSSLSNVVKCWKDFFGYFNTLETHIDHALMLKISNIIFLIAFYGFCLWSLFDFSNCRIDIFGYNISTV